ncbi:transposase [uncultured Muribaculum sp.]|uniref:transposase n=1 Tax=uncultured Muribaculum sp. TaxID=1918613 RepID=UPI0025B77E52|nr:transposase [uncultured Muribaculum sp.]
MADRHQFRATWHDYNAGLYFVTICTYGMRQTLGHIDDVEFFPSPLGALVAEHISAIPARHPDVELVNSVVMPNHIHLVLEVALGASARERPASALPCGCLIAPCHYDAVGDFHHNTRLALVVGAFKAGVTRAWRRHHPQASAVWHPRYHEHIIRNQQSFDMIMKYIDENPENWSRDCFKHPRNVGEPMQARPRNMAAREMPPPSPAKYGRDALKVRT